MPRVGAVILDFDGVVYDSAQKGLERIVQIVSTAGHELPGNINQVLRQNWGVHGTKLIEICFGLDQEISHVLYKQWEEMDAKLFFPLINGAKHTLVFLRYIKNLKVGMLTSRNRENLMAVVKHYELAHFFNCIQAKDDWPFVKPDSRSFDYVLKQLCIVPDQCVYVGDTPVDFECATARGILNVSVLTGIFDKTDFLDIGQKKENIIPSISHLPKWLFDQKLLDS